jgi:chemotaxis protein CheD
MEAIQRQVVEVFLQPGEFWFGDQNTRIRTLLGSCVSITIWHPARKIGGMCHYMLPGRGAHHGGEPDGRYAEEAMLLFLREIRQAGTSPSEYQAKLFGGGNMFGSHARSGSIDVGRRNIERGRELLQFNGFKVLSEHLAGFGHRNIIFDIWSGDVWLKHEKQAVAGVASVAGPACALDRCQNASL